MINPQTLVDDLDLRDMANLLEEHLGRLEILKLALMAPWAEVTRHQGLIRCEIISIAENAAMLLEKTERLGEE